MCFNSTLVRLRATGEECYTILARCFNSTLVRLRAFGGADKSSLWEFQFHVGTIERKKLVEDQVNNARFNSTLVRLRVATSLEEIAAIKFQFHVGTIESGRIRFHQRYSRVSIPRWYD